MDYEKGKETWWLLRYFNQPIDQLWSRLPELSAPGVVLPSEFITAEPLEALAMIFAEHHLTGWGEYFDIDDPELDVLDDLRVLLSYFLVESRSELFRPPGDPNEESIVGTPYMVWRVVRRLCAVALDRPSVRRHAGGSVEVGYFFDRYTTPACHK